MEENKSIIIKEEISKAIVTGIDPVELARVIYPRMKSALAFATDPQEANEIRTQMDTVNTYIRREIPKVMKERFDQFQITHEGDMLYLEASAKAGALSGADPDNRPSGQNKSSENFQRTKGWADYRYKNPRDKLTCERIGELDEQDRKMYGEEMKSNLQQPTLHGLEKVWRMLYGDSASSFADSVLELDVKPVEVKEGEWWRLGNHVLYCGDTSHPDFIGRLPDCTFAFADPPYGAEAADWDNQFYWKHDYLIEVAPLVAVTPGIISIFDFARLTMMPYAWSMACWISNGMTRGAIGYGNWIYIALFTNNNLFQQEQDFIKVSIETSSSDETKHKGRKPSQMITRLLRLFTNESDFVIDPFLGSGMTLFVAEKMNRICVGGEINPEYCGEIIARWELATREKAQRIE